MSINTKAISARQKNRAQENGGYGSGEHLFPSRTEKLSPPAQLVLQFVGEYGTAFFREALR